MEESSLKKFHRRHRCGDGYVCYDGALKEMQGGRKHTSWMWWIFPQVAGLGRSGKKVRHSKSARSGGLSGGPGIGPPLL